MPIEIHKVYSNGLMLLRRRKNVIGNAAHGINVDAVIVLITLALMGYICIKVNDYQLIYF